MQVTRVNDMSCAWGDMCVFFWFFLHPTSHFISWADSAGLEFHQSRGIWMHLRARGCAAQMPSSPASSTDSFALRGPHTASSSQKRRWSHGIRSPLFLFVILFKSVLELRLGILCWCYCILVRRETIGQPLHAVDFECYKGGGVIFPVRAQLKKHARANRSARPHMFKVNEFDRRRYMCAAGCGVHSMGFYTDLHRCRYIAADLGRWTMGGVFKVVTTVKHHFGILVMYIGVYKCT